MGALTGGSRIISPSNNPMDNWGRHATGATISKVRLSINITEIIVMVRSNPFSCHEGRVAKLSGTEFNE